MTSFYTRADRFDYARGMPARRKCHLRECEELTNGVYCRHHFFMTDPKHRPRVGKLWTPAHLIACDQDIYRRLVDK